MNDHAVGSVTLLMALARIAVMEVENRVAKYGNMLELLEAACKELHASVQDEINCAEEFAILLNKETQELLTAPVNLELCAEYARRLRNISGYLYGQLMRLHERWPDRAALARTIKDVPDMLEWCDMREAAKMHVYTDACRILWLSRHAPTVAQKAELQEAFSYCRKVQIVQDDRPFGLNNLPEADDVARRYHEGGFNELVLVGSPVLFARLNNTPHFVQPLCAEMKAVGEALPGKVRPTQHLRFWRITGAHAESLW